MTISDYDHKYEYRDETVRLGVHCSGVAHEPRVRWQVGDWSGEHGYVTLDAPEPVVRLEEGETARLGERVVAELPVPRDIGAELKTACETLGIVVPESARIGTDPMVFPAEIDSFDRLGWEPARNVMWYWRDDQSSPRAYQVEDDELVFRAQEWADKPSSKEALTDDYDLHRPY
jgi:hypothetical protein